MLHSPATGPALQIHWNPFTETWRHLQLARLDTVVFRSLLGIRWMWFFGAVFLATALLNVAVGACIFLLAPDDLLRFVAFIQTRLVCRIKVTGDQHLPVAGAAVVVCNRVSTANALLLMAASPRPLRFILDQRSTAVPVLGWLFRLAKAIPIASEHENPALYATALEAADRVLAEGGLLCIFPEGSTTRDGCLQLLQSGVMKILQRRPVPVVPVALHNLWGAFLSRAAGGQAVVRLLRRGAVSPVTLVAWPALAAAHATPENLQARCGGAMWWRMQRRRSSVRNGTLDRRRPPFEGGRRAGSSAYSLKQGCCF